jgi:hypothetical protein
MTHVPEPAFKTSALEQHLQTIFTAVLTAGILTAIGFAWRSNESMTRVVALQEAQVAQVAQLSADVRAMSDRAVTYEVRLARIETLIAVDPRPGEDRHEARAVRVPNQSNVER